MIDNLRRAVADVRDAAASLDVTRLSGHDAAAAVELLTKAERVCAAARTLAARRVEETKVWQRDGHRTAA